MTPFVFALPGNETFAEDLAAAIDAERGALAIRDFPDGETYLRVEEEVSERPAVVVGTLDRPDEKSLPLFFLAETLRDLGATEVGLVSPYLAYMRQDKRFRPGEGITSQYFGRMLSNRLDWLVTVDPHLHRYDSLDEVYSIPARVVHAAPVLADWISEHVDRPLVVGPDSESEQWVGDVADRADAPHLVLEKTRHGDREVDISVPAIDRWREHTPVLVDDIISTAGTMVEAIGHLRRADLSAPVCVGVHGIFADDAYANLRKAGAREIVTTDTIPHASNGPSVVETVADQLAAEAITGW